jgi:hypothetical protein
MEMPGPKRDKFPAQMALYTDRDGRYDIRPSSEAVKSKPRVTRGYP